MTSSKALSVVEPVALSRLYGLSIEMSTNVFDKLLDRRISLCRLLAQRTQYNCIKIAAQLFGETLWYNASSRGQRLDFWNVVFTTFTARAINDCAWTSWVRYTYGSLEFKLAGCRNLIRAHSGQELEQHYAQGV